MGGFFTRREDKRKEREAEIFQKVRPILAGQLGVPLESVTLESRVLDDLGADSLDVVELVLSLEEEYSIELPDEVVQKMQTVREIVDYIAAHERENE